MKRYTTKSPMPLIEMPARFAGWTCSEILAYARENFDIDPRTRSSKNDFTAYMVAVSDEIFDPAYWKSPICVLSPGRVQEWVEACIIWYHGANPVYLNGKIYSGGYAGDE